MKDSIVFVFGTVPLIILIALAILTFFVEGKKNWDVLKKLYEDIKNCCKYKIFRYFHNKKLEKYNKTVSTKDYLEWQYKVLNKIYKPIIDDFNKRYEDDPRKIKCNEAGLKDFKYKYEALCFNTPDLDIKPPFKELFNKEDVDYNSFDKKRLKEIKKGADKDQRAYYRLVKSKIHYPYNLGYMLESINYQKDFYIKARTGVYLQNVYESNILEYELYKLYKNKKFNKNLENKDVDHILGLLPQRNKIHEAAKDSGADIFSSGVGRNSLLSVSMMVLCKNRSGSYDALRIRRSADVDAKAGFIQFVPSGGFSSLDAGLDFDSQYANASITKGLLREFLEECFGEKDYSGVINHSPEDVYNHEAFKSIDINESIHFVGTALSLVSLRHEMCFLMIIDDENVTNKMKANEESDNTLHYIDVEQLEKKEYWMQYSDDDNNMDDIYMLNATSAALWQLVRESGVYAELKKKIEQNKKEIEDNKEKKIEESKK